MVSSVSSLGSRLNHDDAVFVTDDHDVQRSLLALGVGRVDDELAIDAADAHGAYGRAERNVGQGQGGGGGVDGDDVGVIFLVG